MIQVMMFFGSYLGKCAVMSFWLLGSKYIEMEGCCCNFLFPNYIDNDVIKKKKEDFI